MFRELKDRLAGRVEVCPVELPGRGRRRTEACIHAWPALMAQLMADLRPLLTAPFAFLGYSLGALVALDLAHELKAHGVDEQPQPVALFACASRAPTRISSYALMHRMDDRSMFETLRRLGGIPDQVLASPELIALSAPSLRADLTLYETYVPRAQPLGDIPIHAYSGRDDASVGDTYLAWDEQSDAGFQSRLFPGGHMFLESQAHAMAEALALDLERHMRSAMTA